MSARSKRLRSKQAHKRRENKKQARRETAMETGTRLHKAIFEGHFHVGDSHVGHKPPGNHEQLLAYATMAGLDTMMVIHGGDIVQHVPVHVGEFDIRRAQAALDAFKKTLARKPCPELK